MLNLSPSPPPPSLSFIIPHLSSCPNSVVSVIEYLLVFHSFFGIPENIKLPDIKSCSEVYGYIVSVIIAECVSVTHLINLAVWYYYVYTYVTQAIITPMHILSKR